MAQRNTHIRGEQIADAFFGAALARNGTDENIMDIQVDGSTIEVNADALRVVANGIGANELDETDNYAFSGTMTLTTAPSGANDVVNKTYVDALVNGLDWKNSARLSSQANTNWTTSASLAFSAGTLTITGLTAGSARGLIDAVEPVDGDRILIKDAATASAGAAASAEYNGLWEVTGGTTTSLTLTRTTDADADAEVTANLAVFVEEGTNADTGWVLTTNNPITVNTTALTFTQFTGVAELIAGVGLTKTGSTIDLDLDTLSAVAVDVAADEIAIVDATDGSTKKEAIADVITAVAGDGLAASSGVLALDLNELTAAVIDVSADELAFIDATDNSTKKESVADIMTAVAGNGLAAASGVLSVDLNELSTEATFDPAADFIGIVDATDSGSDKSLWSVIATAIAGSGITANNGVLSADAVADQIAESDFVKSVQVATASQTVMTSFSGSAAVVANSVHVYLNGLLQEEGGTEDYTINTSTGVVTFVVGLDAGDVVTLTGVLDN